MKKIIFLFILITFIYIYIKIHQNEWLLFITNNISKFIVLIIGIIAIMFPRDYDKVPDILYNMYNKNNNSYTNSEQRIYKTI